MEDLRTAAALLNGRKAHPRIRLIVIPATQDLYQQALHEGLIQIFADAGASVAAGVCGPCLGGYMGVLGARSIPRNYFLTQLAQSSPKQYSACGRAAKGRLPRGGDRRAEGSA